MPDIYEDMMAASLEIAAAFPAPRFYADCAAELHVSRTLFFRNTDIAKCRQWVFRALSENFGHGIHHAEKVAVEAGALVLIEGKRHAFADSTDQEMIVEAQIAGLLHDLRRSEKNHAQAGAEAAGQILEQLSPSFARQKCITAAIANHEAFVPPTPIDSPMGQMVSDALYDADKFRWGPDNFTTTLWEMLRSRQAPMGPMIRRFRRGMQGIARIKETFRSEAGKAFGPEFIDLGLRIGEKIYDFLVERYPHER